MGVVQFLYHLDTVLMASDLETLALELLLEIPIPGVEAAAFDSGIIRQTLLQAAVDQKSITTEAALVSRRLLSSSMRKRINAISNCSSYPGTPFLPR